MADSVENLFRKFRDPRKRAILRAFCEVGRIREACKRGKLDYDLHYYWLKTDESYAAAFE